MKKITFQGKTVLITGAGGGIGRALAKEFALRRANLALHSLPAEAGLLREFALDLEEAYGIRTWMFFIDLLDENGPETLYTEVTKSAGDIYALVNNAGSVVYGRFWEESWESQSDMFRLNLYVPMRLMHLFLPDMIRQGKGAVFNTSSVSALQPTPFQSVYGATKAGLLSLSRGLRAELKKTGVTVCTLNPPYVDTGLLKTRGYPPDLRFYTISPKKKPEWVAKKALKAFEEQKRSYIPGVWSEIIHNLLVRISPGRLVDETSRFFLQGWKNPIDP